jgi:hypothetical protein
VLDRLSLPILTLQISPSIQVHQDQESAESRLPQPYHLDGTFDELHSHADQHKA